MNIMDTASVVGVMKAASTELRSTAYLLCRARNPDVTSPSLARMNITSGNSNTSPNPSMRAVRNENASRTLGSACTYCVVYSPSRKRSPWGAATR